MASQSDRRSEITSEILQLSELQRLATENAGYLGWTPETEQAYWERSERLGQLRREWVKLEAA